MERCAKCGEIVSYQGHANYETWSARLWVDNEQGTQEWQYELARQSLRETSDPEDARYQLDGMLKEMIEQMAGVDDLPAGLGNDLLTAALGSVDYWTWAKDLLDELADEEVA